MEVHIFDYSNDLYGQRLEFAPVEFIRREKTFANVEKLIKQIEKDILYTKKVLC
ncbi:MAG: riboflavin kinase [Halanaerobiales bacterium]